MLLSKICWFARLGWKVLCIVMLTISWSGAQTTSPDRGNGIDPGRIPPDSIVFASIQPSKILNLQAFELYPREIITAAGLEYLGFDPMNIERIDVAVGFSPIAVGNIGVMFSALKPVKVAELKNSPFSRQPKKSPAGFSCYDSEDPALQQYKVILAELDDRHFLLGTQVYVERMAKAQEPAGRVAALAKAINTIDELLVIADFGTVRPMVEVQIEKLQEDVLPPFQEPLNQLIKATDLIATRWGERDNYGVKTMLSGKNETDGKTIQSSLEAIKSIGIEIFREQIKGQVEMSAKSQEMPDSIRVAVLQYAERLFGKADQLVVLKRDGHRVVLHQDSKHFAELSAVQMIGVMSALVLPAVQQARVAARRMSSSNNLRQLTLSLLNYESTFRKIPSAAILDKTTKKLLLSWRVAILPFIEEQALYDQFHLDEAWDSPHNIKLLDKMPATFKCPNVALAPGHTNYLAVSGPDFAMRIDAPLGLATFVDGTSNTAVLVEAAAGSAVPWTARQDFTPTQNEPFKGLTPFVNPAGFHVAMMDCSVQFIPREFEPSQLWRLFTRSGND
jgi:Protein of unknown function (DUF1559)